MKHKKQPTMKKLLNLFLVLTLAAGFCSCDGVIPGESGFDESMLVGKWQEGTVFEHYYDTVFERVLATGDTVRANGVTWDEADDITEEEGQLFNWTLTGSTLKHEHIGTFVIVPKLYTITTLDDHELVYDDDYGGKHFFIKVE